MKRNIKTYNRYFSFILYKDDEEQMRSMQYIINTYKYARILHNRDKDGQETKKEHYHIIIYIGKNPRNRHAIAKETNVKENYIEGCNKESMLLYLIHYNNPEKTQYELEEVDGELQKELYELIKSKTEYQKDKLQNIIEYIYKNNANISMITKYCIDNNYYEVLKQNQYLITQIVKEQMSNNEYKKLYTNRTNWRTNDRLRRKLAKNKKTNTTIRTITNKYRINNKRAQENTRGIIKIILHKMLLSSNY